MTKIATMIRTSHEHLVNSNKFVKEISPPACAKYPLCATKQILVSTLHMEIQCVTFFGLYECNSRQT